MTHTDPCYELQRRLLKVASLSENIHVYYTSPTFFFFVLGCCCVLVLVIHVTSGVAISCALPPAPRLFSPADAHRMYVEGELVKVGRLVAFFVGFFACWSFILPFFLLV